ncbi:MAG TPA: hypothetical protein ENK02_13245 [Planctomycetes bacterium]|nr:hypothetical protein [Planctomycetota bacterium]
MIKSLHLSMLLSSVLLFFVSHLHAQTCKPGDILLKNDILPANGGTAKVAIVSGLCVGEAAMSVLSAPGPVKINAVSVLFAHRSATNGIKAVVDIEIYDGAKVSAKGTYTLGPLLFKLSKTSQNLQIQTTGLNVFTLPKPVFSQSGKPVIAFRMVQNLSTGSCAKGYSANFATDNVFACKPGTNILDAKGHGPIDPCTYRGFGVPLYPIYFRGSWVIRACATPTVSVSWTGNPTPGGFLSFKLLAPGQSGDQYLMMMSGGIQRGFSTPWGKVPLDPDPIFSCFFGSCRPFLLRSFGTFNSKGEAFSALSIPNLAILRGSGLTLYAGFFTFKMPHFTPWKSISAPSKAIVIR